MYAFIVVVRLLTLKLWICHPGCPDPEEYRGGQIQQLLENPPRLLQLFTGSKCVCKNNQKDLRTHTKSVTWTNYAGTGMREDWSKAA